MAKIKGRLVSLDIFRGMTIAFMIIVNTPGSWKYVYPPLRHASVARLHPDRPGLPVFPVHCRSITLVLNEEIWAGTQQPVIVQDLQANFNDLCTGPFPCQYSRIFSRDYSTLRIMGVLQRIAIAYFFGAIICLTVNRDYLWIVIACDPDRILDHSCSARVELILTVLRATLLPGSMLQSWGRIISTKALVCRSILKDYSALFRRSVQY